MTHEQTNRRAWNDLATGQSQFARVATDQECENPLLTLDTRGWLPGSVDGLDVLCLASGGGWQAILYACAGARVTVVDISPEMLELDRREADRRRLSLRIEEGSMDDLSMLDDASFDIVHQPVSTCYVPKLEPVYSEVARVLRDGGLYISQHKQPTSLQIAERDERDRYVIGVPYYHADPLPPVPDRSYREPGATEYLHRWEEIVGGLCRSGFVIEDLVEPRRGVPTAKPGDYRHRGMYIAPYLRLKARRVAARPVLDDRSPIWTPSGD
ncbi:class I SAM-dependent methyltransferase [Maioricimonas sp. JC845]|uniref:class I SAM-dependent methyltransferase n=1 Tax=Maioricimonas sp. JC845 TaxID=3232138 RepID=UPI00345AD75B